jgi:glucose-1-phosphate thymidylyltransferase
MQCVILAGGFAKRLLPLTENTPKPLLEVGGKAILDHIMDKLEGLKEISTIFLTTNSKFEPHFREWVGSHKSSKDIRLVIEPPMTEEKKFGSVGALENLIKQEGLDDDLMVIAGDNLFKFELSEFIGFFREKKAPAVAFYDMEDIEKVRLKFGVGILDADNRIVDFREKDPSPPSTLVSTCCYIFPRDTLKSISEYLADENNPDTPGYFILWLAKKRPVYGFVFTERWFDIGSLEELEEARKYYS